MTLSSRLRRSSLQRSVSFPKGSVSFEQVELCSFDREVKELADRSKDMEPPEMVVLGSSHCGCFEGKMAAGRVGFETGREVVVGCM